MNIRNGQEQDQKIHRIIHPIGKKQVAIGKHPVGQCFISGPDGTTADDAPKYIIPVLIAKKEGGIVGLRPLGVELVLGALGLTDIQIIVHRPRHQGEEDHIAPILKKLVTVRLWFPDDAAGLCPQKKASDTSIPNSRNFLNFRESTIT